MPPGVVEEAGRREEVRVLGALFQMDWIGGGGPTSLPPSSGSMMTTAMPFEAAYRRPLVPAWFSTSM